MPELEEIPVVRAPFELWATIKKSSKYYHQGLADPTNRKSKPVPFKIQMVLMTDIDSYDFKGGPGGAYRREDLQLLIKRDGKFKRI